MRNVIIFLVILLSLGACKTNEYIYVNTCLPDICEEPETVEDYIAGYFCKDKIVKSCNKNPSE